MIINRVAPPSGGGCPNPQISRSLPAKEKIIQASLEKYGDAADPAIRSWGPRWHSPAAASKQTEAIIPSLAASFLSSSSAAGAAARIPGTPIRSKGQYIYRMLCDGSGSTQAGSHRPMFLTKLKDLTMGLVERFLSLHFSERLPVVGCVLFCAWAVKSNIKVLARDRRHLAAMERYEASIKDQDKERAA